MIAHTKLERILNIFVTTLWQLNVVWLDFYACIDARQYKNFTEYAILCVFL